MTLLFHHSDTDKATKYVFPITRPTQPFFANRLRFCIMRLKVCLLRIKKSKSEHFERSYEVLKTKCVYNQCENEHFSYF